MIEEFRDKLFRTEYPEVQFTALENRKRPGHPIFVRDDGKVGFPTINSVSFDVGDVIRGHLKLDTDTYFFVEVSEVVQKAKKDKE